MNIYIYINAVGEYLCELSGGPEKGRFVEFVLVQFMPWISQTSWAEGRPGCWAKHLPGQW